MAAEGLLLEARYLEWLHCGAGRRLLVLEGAPGHLTQLFGAAEVALGATLGALEHAAVEGGAAIGNGGGSQALNAVVRPLWNPVVHQVQVLAGHRECARRDTQTLLIVPPLLNAEMARSARSCLDLDAVTTTLLTFAHTLVGEDPALSDLLALR